MIFGDVAVIFGHVLGGQKKLFSRQSVADAVSMRSVIQEEVFDNERTARATCTS